MTADDKAKAARAAVRALFSDPDIAEDFEPEAGRQVRLAALATIFWPFRVDDEWRFALHLGRLESLIGRANDGCGDAQNILRELTVSMLSGDLAEQGVLGAADMPQPLLQYAAQQLAGLVAKGKPGPIEESKALRDMALCYAIRRAVACGLKATRSPATPLEKPSAVSIVLEVADEMSLHHPKESDVNKIWRRWLSDMGKLKK